MMKLVNILLVEDDEVDVMNVKKSILKTILKWSYAWKWRWGTRDVVDLLFFCKIIILDMYLKMNGIEFLKELRIDENLKNISVFVMTTETRIV
jgi:response regulator of citrate/malate metabolism